MILFLDEKRQVVILYTENGSHEIPFVDINTLDTMLEGQTALYVTSATEVDVTDVVSLVYQMSGQEEQILEEPEKDTVFYLWSNSNNKLIVDDVKLSFSGKTDFKLYDEKMKQKINSSIILSALIKKGKISIVGENKKKILLREAMKEKKVIDNKQQKQIDAPLSSMILNKPVADFDPVTDSDAIGIDLTDELGGRRTIGGGGLPNEVNSV